MMGMMFSHCLGADSPVGRVAATLLVEHWEGREEGKPGCNRLKRA